MSRSDNDRESRTAANTPLRQSSFVFLPDEEENRRNILANADAYRSRGLRLLELRRAEVKKQRVILVKIGKRAAKAAEEIGAAATAFAGELPQSVFGGTNGAAFVLSFGALFERIREQQNILGAAIIRLDGFSEPGWFDPDRFLFAAGVLGDEQMKEMAEAAEREGKTVREAAMRLSGEIGGFSETAVSAFYGKAAQAFDLENGGANARFGTLGALCGELRHAAERFAAVCRAI